MANANVNVEQKIELQARVFRVDHSKRPWFIPKKAWKWLGRRQYPGTGRWENLGTIAKSEDGTIEVTEATAEASAPEAPIRDPRITD